MSNTTRDENDGLVPGALEGQALVDFVREEKARIEAGIVNPVLSSLLIYLEQMRKEIPTNEMQDLVMGLRDPKTLTDKERDHIKHRDNGLYIRQFEVSVWNKCLDAVSSTIRELMGEINK